MRRGEVNRNGEILLTRKQRLYIAGVRKGMSRRQAALLAGYSQSSANNPGWNIERRGRGGKPIMRYFWEMLTSASGRNGSEAKRQFPAQVQPDQ